MDKTTNPAPKTESTAVEYTLRPATEADFPEIRKLIRRVRINPTRLDWRRFTVAVSPSGELIGCGQLKPVSGGMTELASLAVEPSYRKQGVAKALIKRLLSDAPRPVYLTCLSRMGGLYEKFGFRALEGEEIPRYYRRVQRLVSLLLEFSSRESLLVMKLG